MKRKISAVLLALGLSVSALSIGVAAAETETEAVEQVTPAEEAAAQTEAAPSQEEMLKANFMQTLGFFDSLDKAQIDAFNDGSYADDVKAFNKAASAGVLDPSAFHVLSGTQLATMYSDKYTNWAGSVMNFQTAMQELGSLVSIDSVEVGDESIDISAIYEKTGADNPVKVVYAPNEETKSYVYTWTIDYSFGQLIQQAGMNTLMGVGIVFLTLLFLSWLIGNLHIIPDMIEKAAKKKEEPAPAPAPVQAAPVVETVEEELADDEELVAVIAAAIAAYENTSSDGFVVRSIKKSSKRNWQRA